MLLFNFAWQPRQSFWEEEIHTSYVIVQRKNRKKADGTQMNLKTSYVIVQLGRHPNV